MTPLEKVDRLLWHIRHVQENCIRLGRELIKRGEVELGVTLIQNGLSHDSSKLNYDSTEWHSLWPGDLSFYRALYLHRKNNGHHIEKWCSIHEIPKVCTAEMVCDVVARGNEFGTDIRKWVKKEIVKKYKLTTYHKVYQEIYDYLDILLDKPFEKV